MGEACGKRGFVPMGEKSASNSTYYLSLFRNKYRKERFNLISGGVTGLSAKPAG